MCASAQAGLLCLLSFRSADRLSKEDIYFAQLMLASFAFKQLSYHEHLQFLSFDANLQTINYAKSHAARTKLPCDRWCLNTVLGCSAVNTCAA